MTARRILGLIGLLTMVVGVTQLFKPRTIWGLVDSLAVGRLYGPPPATIYVVGAFSIVLGLFLLYVCIRRLTTFSTLIWVIGAISLLSGLMMVLTPEFERDLLRSLFFNRSDAAKLTMSYIGGVARFFIGVLLLIAAFGRPPVREATQVQQPETDSETSG